MNYKNMFYVISTVLIVGSSTLYGSEFPKREEFSKSNCKSLPADFLNHTITLQTINIKDNPKLEHISVSRNGTPQHGDLKDIENIIAQKLTYNKNIFYTATIKKQYPNEGDPVNITYQNYNNEIGTTYTDDKYGVVNLLNPFFARQYFNQLQEIIKKCQEESQQKTN
jgi:hypothetical protein